MQISEYDIKFETAITVQSVSILKHDATITNPRVKTHDPYAGTFVTGSNSPNFLGIRRSFTKALVTLA